MKRRVDWPERLAACAERARSMPFAWGSHDCALWAADVVLELTGVDMADGFRGRYDSASGALRAVLEADPGGFEAMMEGIFRRHDCPEVPAAYAQRGDAVLCLSGLGSWPLALGICFGRQALTVGERGLVSMPMESVARAWRI